MSKQPECRVTENQSKASAGPSIGEHGVIGNLETVALVGRDACIDFLCWPTLDGPTIFAALLDRDKGGSFDLSPDLPNAVTRQLYHPETNVLITRWLSDEASAEVTDFMPHPATTKTPRRIVRRLRSTRGRVGFSVHCSPRPDYARQTPAVLIDGKTVLFTSDGMALKLEGDVSWQAGEGSVDARGELDEGQSIAFVLSDPYAPAMDADEIEVLLGRNIDQWQAWSRSSHYKGRWREMVSRSALALKLLTSQEHGSIAAAATFGLPEVADGGRNWDYRFTWIRDATFTVYAFLRLGHHDEAEQFRSWLSARSGAPDQLHIMYRLDGSEAPEEIELSHLSGYRGNKPVRIGNAARGQTQLDIFGEMMDAIYLSNKYGKATSHEGWKKIVRTVEYVATAWDTADAGIWEFRDKSRHLLHSRLMCWVCVDRALRLANKRSYPAPLVAWRELRDAIATDIWTNFRHPEHSYFVQEKHGTELDAALLMMPLVRFVSATDPVWLATLDAIGEKLTSDGLVWRYRSDDGLGGMDGAFTTCLFWYVECLARAGRLKAAQLEMEKCLGYANHLGLFSEELDRRGVQFGNFPQALTHLALISAAYFLDRRLDRPLSDEWQP